MDDFNNMIAKYTNIVNINLIREYNKIEFDLINDPIYKKLDMDEQTIVIDMIKSSIESIDKPVINTNITTNKPTISAKPTFGFGSKPKFGVAYAQAQAHAKLEYQDHHDSSNSNTYKTKYVPNSYNFNKNNIATNLSQDPNLKSEGE